VSEELHPDSDIEERQAARLKAVMGAISLLRSLIGDTGPSREASLALTKLDEVEMWSEKAIKA
jgi:hypothetical protein